MLLYTLVLCMHLWQKHCKYQKSFQKPVFFAHVLLTCSKSADKHTMVLVHPNTMTPSPGPRDMIQTPKAGGTKWLFFTPGFVGCSELIQNLHWVTKKSISVEKMQQKKSTLHEFLEFCVLHSLYIQMLLEPCKSLLLNSFSQILTSTGNSLRHSCAGSANWNSNFPSVLPIHHQWPSALYDFILCIYRKYILSRRSISWQSQLTCILSWYYGMRPVGE